MLAHEAKLQVVDIMELHRGLLVEDRVDKTTARIRSSFPVVRLRQPDPPLEQVDPAQVDPAPTSPRSEARSLTRGRNGFDGDDDVRVARRGAPGHVKRGN